MTLVEQMRALTAECLQAYDRRVTAVADIRATTLAQCGELRAAHKCMAAEQRRRLTQHMHALRGDTTAFLQELDGAHEAMAAGQRKRLAAQARALRTETAAFLKHLDATHEAMAAEQHERLASFVAELANDTGAFLKELDAAHEAMAAEQRKGLAAQARALRKGTAAFLRELDAAHGAMAAEQQTRLAGDRGALASQMSAMRAELQDELGGTRRAWHRFAAVMQQRRSGRQPSGPRPRKAADDLTQIRGIGPAAQRRLNKAGLSTFAQLASATPKQLRKALGDAARRLTVDEVLEQARDLAGVP
jgi:predicted flap endonuclease-1-like 5' DNA nuclease